VKLDSAGRFDVIVIGAGITGLYALHKLRDERGLSVVAFEAGTDVGGTWYWNRVGAATLLNRANSWFHGTNVPGKAHKMVVYAGGPRLFKQKCDEVAARGYEGFRLG
jgi:cyclohexanone monooxygenase